MSILAPIAFDQIGAVEVRPRKVRMITADSFAMITAAGYINPRSVAPNVVKSTDVWEVIYNYNTTTKIGTYQRFTTSISSQGVITLVGSPADTLMTEVSLTAAQFNGMYGAPVLLVAAQGANTIIVPRRMLLTMTYGTAQFSAGGVVAAQYGSTTHGGGTLCTNSQQASDFTGASASTMFVFNGASGNSSQATFANCANVGIYLSNASGAFTTGDSTFKVRMFYDVIASNS